METTNNVFKKWIEKVIINKQKIYILIVQKYESSVVCIDFVLI